MDLDKKVLLADKRMIPGFQSVVAHGCTQRMMMSVRNCPKCCIFEAKPQIPPMEPILCTEPLDLVHIDYISMEVMVGMTEKPVVKNVLVIEDHFTRFTQAYVTVAR